MLGLGPFFPSVPPEDNKLHPCAFFSHRLSPAERNYDVGNRELLAVVLALQEWRHWLEGAPEIIKICPIVILPGGWTHVKPVGLCSSEGLSSLLHNGLAPGMLNLMPDHESSDSTTLNPDMILPPYCVITAAHWDIEKVVREAQRTDPDPGNGPPNCLFVPNSARSQVLQWGHSTKLSCHSGILRTLTFIKQRF